MKHKIIIVSLIVMLIMTGCFNPLISAFNIGDWEAPDNYEFKTTISMLETPCKCSGYMKSNFVYEYHEESLSPLELWEEERGDCNDFSVFFVYAMNYHDYETWQIRLLRTDSEIYHWLGVIRSKQTGNYLFCNNQYYQPFYGRKTFEEIVDTYCLIYNHEWSEYKVYNYEGDLIEAN